MQSLRRLEQKCSGGNLLKIHTNKCTNGQCEAKLDGASTREKKAQFWIINIATGKKCIEVCHHGYTYALKAVVNSNNVTFIKNQRCVDTLSNEFQFEEDIISEKPLIYKFNIDNNKCLGVKEGCDDATLYLISYIEGKDRDRRCFFQKP